MKTVYEYTWFILNQRIVKREFALSGSEQNPDLTNKDLRQPLGRAASKTAAPAPVEAFKKHGVDFVVERNLADLVAGMNRITAEPRLTSRISSARWSRTTASWTNTYCKDMQIAAIRGARLYRGDRLIRAAKRRRPLDPNPGRLIAVRLNTLTRKTLGGLETDLSARVFRSDGQPLPGLYAAVRFGGGGMHGYRALEGTFLSGCIFSGRTAGRAAAASFA